MLNTQSLFKLGLTLATGLACACLPLNAAENYKTLPVQELTRGERGLASDFNRAKVPTSPAAQDALRKQIVMLVSKLTQPSEIINYSKHRKDISLILSERNQTPEARAIVVTSLIQYAGGVATRDTFSPAARINCTAVLAELDEAVENSRERKPPMPARGAYDSLFKLASASDTPAYIRAVALHGLERQARVYWFSSIWDDARRAEVTKAAVDIITATPSELEQTQQAWLVRRAYDLLTVGKSAAAVDAALEHVANPKALPTVRLSALAYMSSLDAAALTADQAKLFLVGASHLVRGQLVDWYEFEEDIIKRDSNATGGGYGGMGMGGMGGMGSGYGGEGEGDPMGGYGGRGMGGMGMGGYGGEGSGGVGGAPKPIDTQDWKTRVSRRLLNQVTQAVHVALDGRPLVDVNPRVAAPLTSVADEEVKTKASELAALIDDVQKAINDPAKITDLTSLMQESMLPIEEIMDFVKEVPGFAARYPELADAEQLDEVPEAAPAADGNAAPVGAAPGSAPAADGSAPAGAAPLPGAASAPVGAEAAGGGGAR